MSDHADICFTWALVLALYGTLAGVGLVLLTTEGALVHNVTKEAETQVDQYANFVEEYYVYTGEWPPSLDALVTPPRGVAPFVGEVRSDPWREPYWYRRGGPRGYTLCSGGPDRRLDTDDDICG